MQIIAKNLEVGMFLNTQDIAGTITNINKTKYAPKGLIRVATADSFRFLKTNEMIEIFSK
jgi:hypothetical protein